MYVNQGEITGEIPILKTVETMPVAPDAVNMDRMTVDGIHAMLQRGCNDIAAVKVHNAAEAFTRFRENQ
ncbi:MAG: hypothetical protein LIP12_10770 [Clostridiales bacterium]|nr:hypothetical protein [Clostridiales bacterium]